MAVFPPPFFHGGEPHLNHISLDIETYSSVDLNKSSVYRYSEAPDFEILLLGYSVDDDPVQVVDLASGERIPEEILAALTDERVTKWAFNANFERVCLSRYLGMPKRRVPRSGTVALHYDLVGIPRPASVPDGRGRGAGAG